MGQDFRVRAKIQRSPNIDPEKSSTFPSSGGSSVDIWEVGAKSYGTLEPSGCGLGFRV